MAIDVINSRNDIRAMTVNNVGTIKKEAVDKISKDLMKRAYPDREKKVHSFDDIDKLFKGL